MLFIGTSLQHWCPCSAACGTFVSFPNTGVAMWVPQEDRAADDVDDHVNATVMSAPVSVRLDGKLRTSKVIVKIFLKVRCGHRPQRISCFPYDPTCTEELTAHTATPPTGFPIHRVVFAVYFVCNYIVNGSLGQTSFGQRAAGGAPSGGSHTVIVLMHPRRSTFNFETRRLLVPVFYCPAG